MDSQATLGGNTETSVLPEDSAQCVALPNQTVGDEGLEVLTETPMKTSLLDQRGTESGTPDAHSTLINTDLQSIIDEWAELPRSVQARIMALVKAEAGKR